MQRLMELRLFPLGRSLRARWTQIILVACAGLLMLLTQACSEGTNAKSLEGLTPESSPVTVPQSLTSEVLEFDVAPKI